jgi:hypothetical protein
MSPTGISDPLPGGPGPASATGLPVLSVVVPSVNGWQDLEGSLAALERERNTTPLEVLVPERCGDVVRNALARRFPWARILPVGELITIPGMRALAFQNAASPTVAVIEDHVLVPPGWARRMVEARAGEVRVVGGGVVNAATGRTIDWAAFLCEYSHLLAPLPNGPATWLTGNNTAYERALLAECRDVIETGQWEDVLHEAFRKRGVVLWCRPDIIVGHKKHYTVGEYTSQRFLYARAYAAAKLRGASAAQRLVRGALSLALPPVLFYRIVARVWRSGAHRSELLRSLPLLAVFVLSWGLGEAAGSWFGDGGALAKVK